MNTSRDRFIAFLGLLGASTLVMMAVILIGRDGAEPIVQLVDKWQNGIIGVIGVSAGLLFRTSASEPKGTPGDPVNVTDVKS